MRAEQGDRGEGISMGGVTVNFCSSSTLMLMPGGGIGSRGSVEVGDAEDSQEGFPEASDMKGQRGWLLWLSPHFFYVGRKHPSGAFSDRGLRAVEQISGQLAPMHHLLQSSPSILLGIGACAFCQ